MRAYEVKVSLRLERDETLATYSVVGDVLHARLNHDSSVEKLADHLGHQ